MTKKANFNILNTPIPRLCNGSTSDSGSDCGGSNPPWGTKKAVHKTWAVFFYKAFWLLRISV